MTRGESESQALNVCFASEYAFVILFDAGEAEGKSIHFSVVLDLLMSKHPSLALAGILWQHPLCGPSPTESLCPGRAWLHGLWLLPVAARAIRKHHICVKFLRSCDEYEIKWLPWMSLTSFACVTLSLAVV